MSDYMSSYYYEFRPNKDAIFVNSKAKIIYKGEIKLLEPGIPFCFESKVKLTKDEANETVKGTIGYELTNGNFKILIDEKNNR